MVSTPTLSARAGSIRAELATVRSIAGFDLDRAATRIAALDHLEEIKSELRTLSDRKLCQIAHFIAHQLSWSSGSDEIGKGADAVLEELREEDAANARIGNGLA